MSGKNTLFVRFPGNPNVEMPLTVNDKDYADLFDAVRKIGEKTGEHKFELVFPAPPRT